MFGIPSSVEYGLRAAVYLARHYAGGKTVKAPEIAAAQNVPLPFLERLLARLSRAGLVTSTRGAAGGHRLAQPPERIQVLDAVEALTATERAATAARGDLGFLWERCQEAWREPLRLSLADLAAEIDQRERNLTFCI